MPVEPPGASQTDRMIHLLRMLGYSVTVPADCRRAGPWQHQRLGAHSECYTRHWEDSRGRPGTSVAAHVSMTSDGWTWYARLAKNHHKGSSSHEQGRACEPGDALSAADEALQRMLMGCREGRMADFARQIAQHPVPDETLGLPRPGDPAGLEIPC